MEELCKLSALQEKVLETSFTFGKATGLEAPATKNPTPRVTGEWGWKDGWFSETGLLAATEYEGESTKAEKGGGGGLGDGSSCGDRSSCGAERQNIGC